MENSFNSDLEQYFKDYSASKLSKTQRNQQPLKENTGALNFNQLGLHEKNELLTKENTRLKSRIQELETR